MCVPGEHGFSNVGPSLHLKARIGIGYFLFLWLKFGGPSNSQTHFSFFLVDKWEKKLERLFLLLLLILQSTSNSREVFGSVSHRWISFLCRHPDLMFIEALAVSSDIY